MMRIAARLWGHPGPATREDGLFDSVRCEHAAPIASAADLGPTPPHPEERARRRASQVGLDVQEVLKRQKTRDTRDASAGRSTLEAPADAIELDTTELTLEAVIDKVGALAHQAQQG